MKKEIIGDCTLYLGDCMEVMAGMEDKSVDAVVTDPPFGVGNFVQVTGNIHGRGGSKGVVVGWNDAPPGSQYFSQIKRISLQRIIWGANYFNCFEKNGGAIVWVKDQHMPNFSKAEVASCSHLKKTEMVRIPWNGSVAGRLSQTDHPCERPVSLYKWCIDYLPYCAFIMDPFMGSGSVGVACLELGRKFIGIEKEPRYFDIACKRIDQANRQGKLFV